MIQKKKGFTLIELMAVIVVLAIIAVASVSGVSVLLKNIKEKNSKEMRENLKDTGIIYALDAFNLQKCSETFSNQVFNNGNISDYSSNTSCARKITVATLKSEGLFEDKKGYCKDTDYIIVYRYNVNGNSEYKAYVNDAVCTNY